MLRDGLDNSVHPAINVRALNLWYGSFQALIDIDLHVKEKLVTSLIGPSGCGKSSLLRCINRINERLDYVRISGVVEVLGHAIYELDVEVTRVRKRVGMVFQRPNPLPLSIRDNVIFGYKLTQSGDRRTSGEQYEELVEHSLKQVLLWDSVKDKLDHPALDLSLEKQQKLCIARLLPTKPAVLLMDEPCSALDPAGTEAIEELIWDLRGQYTTLIVTHNMAQARRVSEECVFMLMGKVLEHQATEDLFLTPEHEDTANYIEGRYG
ncbi:MAG: phosphate ABC transporter ATP-binding protein [Gemmatimonadales bacterium]